jgi:hypothetical protein
MNEASSENFFFSDSLKDLIDQQSILNESIIETMKDEGAVKVVGKFLSRSMKDDTMSLEVSSKIAKFLLMNPKEVYAFAFMDDVWLLNSKGIFLEQCSDGEKFKATLSIEGRQ